ncbi:hypothetical protein NEH52_21985, partial [Xanthomonas hortorum pv. pelargonii]
KRIIHHNYITSQQRGVEVIGSFQHSYPAARRHEIAKFRAMNMTAQRRILFHTIELITQIK